MTQSPDHAPESPLAGSGDEVARLSALVDGIVDNRRAVAHLQAEEARLLADAMAFAREQMERIPSRDSRKRDIAVRSVAAEIATAVRASDRTIQTRMDNAHTLTTRFAATLRALEEGRIDRLHAGHIVDAGVGIDDDDARAEYESAAIDVAERETPGRLRPVVQLLAQKFDPRPLIVRHREAARRRGVWVSDGFDGISRLHADIPSTQAHGILDRLNQYARAMTEARATDSTQADADSTGVTAIDTDADTTSTDKRTMDQLRADVFCDLLLTGHATAEDSANSIPEGEAIRAHVQITIPVLTLLGTPDSDRDGAAGEPCDLAGHGPIDPVTAGRLAGTAAGWDRVLTHPITGCVLAVDRYRPSDQQRRLLRVRDEHCRFPGCRQPVRRCDLDHTIAREHDGPTEIGNLAHLCRRHHVLKHNSAWKVRQVGDGSLEWTSPTGRQHMDKPARTLTFTAESDPPPF